MKGKFLALAVLSGGFMMALGCSYIPNLGSSFSNILGGLGLGG